MRDILENRRDETDKLRINMYQYLGAILNSYNILEDNLRRAISNFIGIDDYSILDPLLGCMSSRQLVDAYTSLALKEAAPELDLVSAVNKLALELKDRADERNRLVHAVWGIEIANDDYIGIYYSRYKRSSKNKPGQSLRSKFTEKDYQDIVNAITKAHESVDKITIKLLTLSKK